MYENEYEFEDTTEAEGTFHAELRQVIEQAEAVRVLNPNTPLALLIPQAQALLALPEESVAAMVAAAQSMVGAASFGRGGITQDTMHGPVFIPYEDLDV